MKRLVVFLFAISSTCVFTVHTSHAATVGTSGAVYGPSTLYSGLVGWWTFDGKNTHWTSSTAATTDDVSGNGNTGTLNGMNISTAPVQGKIGQALSFLGTNPFVNITENSHLPVFNTTGYSVALWFKYTGPANTGNNPVLFGESQSGGSAKAAMNMRLNTACVLAVFIRNDALTTMLDPSTVYSNRNFCIDGTTNDWHHVVWVDAHGTATMYIDGVADSTNFNYTPSGTFTMTADEIGAFCDTGCGVSANMYGNFVGTLDDVRFYNRALSASEISQLYNDTNSSRIASTPTHLGAPGSSLNSGLVGYWTFDGKNTHWTSSTAATTDDVSGNGNTGTLNSLNIATAPVQGKVGQGLAFNGTNQSVKSANISSLVNATAASLCFWGYRSSSTNNLNAVFDDGSTANRFGIEVYGPFDQVAIAAEHGSGNYPNFRFTGTGWHYFCAVFNGSLAQTSRVQGYLDGVAQTMTQNGAGNPTTIMSSAEPFQVGFAPSDFTFSNGTIDDVRIYNRALSASEIQQLYNDSAGNHLATSQTAAAPGSSLSQGLVGYWTFDGKNTHWTSPTAATTDDVSGNGNTGTLNGMNISTAPVQGKIGQALKFDGSTQYISALAPSGISGNADMSICAWFNTNSISIPQAIVDFGLDGADHVFSIYINLGGNGKVSVEYDSDSYASTASNLFNTNTWNLLCATKAAGLETTNTILYLNGTVIPASGGSGVNPNIGNTATYIGRWINSADFFNGSIDQVRIYNRVLSAQEIIQLYRMER